MGQAGRGMGFFLFAAAALTGRLDGLAELDRRPAGGQAGTFLPAPLLFLANMI
uniref:Uncharacterized protein n=1 Tax=Setaria viridis TaxID=4556 RepID=A0A4U6UFU1_SETVI|nr:hypothetical protein SEVIR_5G203701v2 [Setaria viridis]